MYNLDIWFVWQSLDRFLREMFCGCVVSAYLICRSASRETAGGDDCGVAAARLCRHVRHLEPSKGKFAYRIWGSCMEVCHSSDFRKDISSIHYHVYVFNNFPFLSFHLFSLIIALSSSRITHHEIDDKVQSRHILGIM